MISRKSICVFAVFIQIWAVGQTNILELSFTGDHSGYYTQLDSIRITNMSRYADTVIFYPDTILTIYLNAGNNELTTYAPDFKLYQNSPNPIVNTASIKLEFQELAEVYVSIIDVSGRICYTKTQTLLPGVHSYKFLPGNSPIYILSISAGTHSQSIKMINASNSNISTQLKYLGVKHFNKKTHTKEHGHFDFQEGDTLSYTGYATNQANIIISGSKIDAPQESSSIFIEVSEGVPCHDEPFFTYLGQTYNTVLIGTQCWMKENLNAGKMIHSSKNMDDPYEIEKYCYNDDSSNCDKYGGLYRRWETQYCCPSGWRLPSDSDWEILADYCGGNGGKLKQTGTSHWNSPNEGATNESGFTALPGGMYNFYGGGEYMNIGDNGYWWSNTQYLSGFWWMRSLNYNNGIIDRHYYDSGHRLSVCCIKSN